MIIETLSCDICGQKEPYSINPIHEHPELELGGVPLNIWTPEYTFQTDQKLQIDNTKRGIKRFHQLLPIELDEKVCSNEGNTPLIRMGEFYLKDESSNPTGSFKDRGIAALVSEAYYHGIQKIAIPSTGNAAISLGYYCNRVGIETVVFIPVNTPAEKVRQIRKNSEIIIDLDLIESYEHFFRFCKENKEVQNGFPANNVAYIQGLKTTAYEIFMQLGNRVPDYVLVPVGSGGNMVGLYYGFKDLKEIGVTEKMPHLISVQIIGGDPITVGYETNQHKKLVVLKGLPNSKAEAIISDTCFNYFKILKILNETKGQAISVSDDDIDKIGSQDNLEYSSRAVFPVFNQLQKKLSPLGCVVLLGTGSNK